MDIKPVQLLFQKKNTQSKVKPSPKVAIKSTPIFRKAKSSIRSSNSSAMNVRRVAKSSKASFKKGSKTTPSYTMIKGMIAKGSIRPSTRAIQAQGTSPKTAVKYLSKMVEEGILQKNGNTRAGHTLVH